MKKQSEKEKVISPKIAEALSRLQLMYTRDAGASEVFECMKLFNGRNVRVSAINTAQIIRQMLLVNQVHPLSDKGIDHDHAITSKGLDGDHCSRGYEHTLFPDRFTFLTNGIAEAIAVQKFFNQPKNYHYA